LEELVEWGAQLSENTLLHGLLALATVGISSLVLVAPVFASSENGGSREEVFAGATRVGDEAVTTAITVVPRDKDAVELRFRLERPGLPPSIAVVHLDAEQGHLEFDGVTYLIPDAIARSWLLQLKGPLEAYLAVGLRPGDQSGRLETPSVVEISPGLSAKVQLELAEAGERKQEIRQIRIFGLDEWGNSFHSFVSLGLSLEGRNATEDSRLRDGRSRRSRAGESKQR